MSRRPRTVGQMLVRKFGYARASRVMLFVSLWSLYRLTEGHDPARTEDLVEVVAVHSRSRVYQWQQDFREAFPQYATPGEFLDDVAGSRTVNVRQVGQLVV